MEPRKVGKKSKRAKQPKSPELSEEDKMSIEDEDLDITSKKNPNNEEDWEDEEITVEFEFYEPNPNQFFAVKSLINGYLDGLSYRSSDLAQLIIDQKELGTMIGTEDEEDENAIKSMPKDKSILAFATLMSFQQYHKQKVFEEIIKYLEDKSLKHNDKHSELIKLLNEKNVGLLINERIINLSPKLVPLLHGQVLKDLEVNKGAQKPNILLDFDYVLCVTKIFKDISLPTSKKKKNELNFKDFIFQKFEDYAFLQKSTLNFMFPGTTSKNNAGITNLEAENNKEQCYRLVWLTSMKDFEETVKTLDQYLEG